MTPRTAREYRLAAAFALAGALLTLGATQVPGMTIEPAHATACRADLAACHALAASAEERIARCWEKFREVAASPVTPP